MDIEESRITLVPVRVFYLKMDRSPERDLPFPPGVSIRKLQQPLTIESYLRLYTTVGIDYDWLDRLLMDREELTGKINAPNVHVYVLIVDGEDAGFAELVREQNYVEVLYFGLFPGFVGKSLGRPFLQWSINTAWSFNPKWVQVNTCELDHPHALAVYQNAGFVLERTETETRRTLRRTC